MSEQSFPKILAIDTATHYLSVGFLKVGKIIVEHTALVPRQHSSLLPEFVDGVLKYADEKLSEDIIIAISVGPGSYTGLRVGISFVLGMVASCPMKVITVDTLKGLAFCYSPNETPVAVIVDTRAGGVYACLYNVLGKPSPIIESSVFQLDKLAHELSSRGKILLSCEEDIYNSVIKQIHGTEVIYGGTPRPSAGKIAKIAEGKAILGQFTELELLEPKYLQEFKPGKFKRKPILKNEEE